MSRPRITISNDRDQPLYRQLREALEHEIATGALDPREPLPSSRELARELGISRNTVNAAYMELTAEGYVDARPRRGLFINAEITRAIERRQRTPVHNSIEWSRVLRPTDNELPEIEKVRDWHSYPFPFVAGQVDSLSFPRLAWLRSLRQALEPEHIHYSLRDGIDEDDPLLIDLLCRRVLPGRGIEAEPDEVMITLGAQQGLDLLATATIRPGDRVGLEDPGYPDAAHIYRNAGAELLRLPVDSHGLVPPTTLSDLRLLHLTPSHHCPTNVTLSIARRRRLLDLAGAGETLVVEDDYDSEFRYHGRPSPALKAMTGSDLVVYLGTFSKFLAPGLRLGYLVGHPDLIAALKHHRRYRIRHLSGHEQRAMALFIETGQYHRTVRRRRGQLSRRWRVAKECLARELGFPADVPPGGVSIWVKGPRQLDGVRLAHEALHAGVIIERGDIYFGDPDAHRNYFRLGFVAIDEDAIEPGIERLAGLVRAQLDR